MDVEAKGNPSSVKEKFERKVRSTDLRFFYDG
jgi:hypothetical protein